VADLDAPGLEILPDVSQDWDPFDPDTLADPLATHSRLRAQCPVAHTDRAGGFWSLFKYDDIVAAARDPEIFSNALNSTRGERRQIPLESDPPEHTAYRRFLNTYFGVARINALEPAVRRIVDDLIAPLLDRGTCDFTPEVAYPLPARTLCAFLNQPDDDWLELKRMADELFRTQGNFTGSGDGQVALEAIYAYARSIVQARREMPRDPHDDLATGLLGFEFDGRRLDDEEVVGILRLMLTAGHNSTTSALGIVALYLARHPDSQQFLRANPDRLSDAIEEILRWDECILDRDARRSLVFGYGIHNCVGAPLARLELRVMFEELLLRTSEFHVVGDVARSHWPRYGVTTLPLKLLPTDDCSESCSFR
jgi:cytochrome P450